MPFRILSRKIVTLHWLHFWPGSGNVMPRAGKSRLARCQFSQLGFFRGTLAPFFRASERPIAIACFLFFTRPPLPAFPDLRVPRFRRLIALLTVFCAVLPYLAIVSPLCSSMFFLLYSTFAQCSVTL